MHQVNGRLGHILWCRTYLFLSFWRSCSNISTSSYIVRAELWYRILWTGFQLSDAPEPLFVIQRICFLSIADTTDTQIGQQFGILTDSIMVNCLQSIARENRYQHLESPETDPSQYISNHPGIERLSTRYRVDVFYPKTWHLYSRLNCRISPIISLLSNEIQAHLRSSLLSSVMVSDLTRHTYSIQWLILTCRHPLFTYDSTPDMPLNHEYPLYITFESVAASTQRVICQTLNF